MPETSYESIADLIYFPCVRRIDNFRRMKPDIELLQLEQFIAVARAKNFTRASKELNLSQSAVSRSVQRLEEQLGQPLFERKPREVTLTDFGELLHERAKQILKLVEDSVVALSEEGKQGRIRLGAIPTIAPYFLPPLLSSFTEKHAHISVLVQEDTSENLIKRCNHGEIDLAILALPLFVKHLELEELFQEELLLVVPPDHHLASIPEITPEAVEEHPFITLNEAHCLSENIQSFCRQQSVQPVSTERISQLATVQELVSLGHGVSLIPEMASRLDSSKRRVYRSFQGEKPTRTIAMIWNPYRYQSKWLSTLRDHIREFHSFHVKD